MPKERFTPWREKGRHGYTANLANLTELRRQLISITGIKFAHGATDDQKNTALVARVTELAALKAIVEAEVRRQKESRPSNLQAEGA